MGDVVSICFIARLLKWQEYLYSEHTISIPIQKSDSAYQKRHFKQSLEERENYLLQQIS